jgi:hypothetical protein
MKKIPLVLILLIAVSAVSLSAWEPDDLTKYPSCMDAGDLIINIGAGLPTLIWSGLVVPPVRVSVDYNLPIGDMRLPFFVGGILGYSYANYHSFSFGGRFGYHFNWGVDNLDTYAVTTAGWIVFGGGFFGIGYPFVGIDIGARYFINKNFGFWAEAGINTFSLLNIGLAFKF